MFGGSEKSLGPVDQTKRAQKGDRAALGKRMRIRYTTAPTTHYMKNMGMSWKNPLLRPTSNANRTALFLQALPSTVDERSTWQTAKASHIFHQQTSNEEVFQFFYYDEFQRHFEDGVCDGLVLDTRLWALCNIAPPPYLRHRLPQSESYHRLLFISRRPSLVIKLMSIPCPKHRVGAFGRVGVQPHTCPSMSGPTLSPPPQPCPSKVGCLKCDAPSTLRSQR